MLQYTFNLWILSILLACSYHRTTGADPEREVGGGGLTRTKYYYTFMVATVSMIAESMSSSHSSSVMLYT